MRKKNIGTLFALIITVLSFSFPLNAIFTNNAMYNSQILTYLTNIGDLYSKPIYNPYSNDDILSTAGNDLLSEWVNNPERFSGETTSDTTITCNLTKSSYDDSYERYSDVSDYYLSTNGFNSTFTNMTLFSIYIEGDEFDVELDHSDGETYKLPYLANYPRYLMSFTLNNGFSGYLQQLEIYLKRTSLTPTTVDVRVIILNSTWNSALGRNEPNQTIPNILSGQYVSTLRNWLWVICSGNGIFLDVENTANNTFYVLPYILDSGASVVWNYNPDGYDEGNAYSDNGVYNLLALDFCLRNIQIDKFMPKPSQIYMKINEVPLTDGPLLYTHLSESELIYAYSGNYTEYNVLNGESGSIYFDIKTNYIKTVYFLVNVTSMLENKTASITRCFAVAGNAIVQWNTTINGVIFPSESYSKAINVLVPHSWNVINVTYQNNTEENWGAFAELPHWRVNWSPTVDGSWAVISETSNLMGNINVYNTTNQLPYDVYFLNDTISINSTLTQNIPEKANLTVFNRLNNSVYNDQVNIVNYDADFAPWQIIQNSSLNGTHWIRVITFNGTVAGINLTRITCNNEPTTLSVVNGPDPPEATQGDPITAKIYYNDTYAPNGVQGAVIDSNWTYSSLNLIDWGNGYYNITFNTLFAPNGTYTIEINATKSGYETAKTIIQFNVTIEVAPEPTEFSIVGTIPYTGENIFVNDTKKYAIVNYTYLNGTGIIGASIQTIPDWGDPYFQAEDLSLGNASLRGLYKIWLDTTGTHSYEQHTINFFAQKPQHEPGSAFSDPFLIEPIPTALDVSGYENITYFEGETAEIAAYFKDSYHEGNPAITSADVNWTINSTPSHSSDMALNIVIYEGMINLPELEIAPGTYNVTIKAQQYDFAPISKNITLNVLPKYETTIIITNHSKTEIRVGKDVIVAAEIQFSNSSLNRTGLALFFDVAFSDGFKFNEFRITNSSGMATITFDQLPEITWINVTVFYEGTPQIKSNSSNYKITVLGKYQTNLTLFDSHLESPLISGELISINATLKYNNSGTWVPFTLENIEFVLLYTGYESESVLLTTDSRGKVTLEFTPPDGASNVMIMANYTGNITFADANDVSSNYTISKYNVSLSLFDFNPLEMLVGNPMVLSCKLIYSDTGVPIANQTVTFFFYIGDPSIRIYSQSAVTNDQGIATTALLLLQPFEMMPYLSAGVEYEGDESTATATSTSSIPIIPMTTTKYITNYLNENWWWMAVILGSVIGATLAYRYGVSLPRKKRLIELQKKIAVRVKDAQNLKHAMIVHKVSGTAIFGEGYGVELDSDLISGFLTAISAFQTEIGVKGKKKESEMGGFELNYADFKILLTDGPNSRFAFITKDRVSDNFRKTAQETVAQFEKEYAKYLKDWSGALAPFRTASRLLQRNFETGMSQPLRVKKMDDKGMKGLNDLAQALVRIANSQQEKGGGKFLIENIVQIAVQARKEEEYEIYYEIYNLYKNRIFRPFSKTDEEIFAEEIKEEVKTIKKAQKPAEKEEAKSEIELVKGIFVPNLSKDEHKKIIDAIESMSPTNQKVFTKHLMFTPDEKRTKIVKDFLKKRQKLLQKLNENSSNLEKLLQKDPPPFREIFYLMESDKEIYEALGNEEKASILALDIQPILEKFESTNVVNELKEKLNVIINEAKNANQNQEFLKAALFYRKGARIYVELGNTEDAERLVEIANYAEQKT
ncbi:MAG: hypothetical protein ACTSRG_19010 [Candidatus Helarchaeota archaeon]